MPISANVVLGRDVKIFHPDLVNLYGCTVGDDTKIGAFVEIQKNAAIGSRCKISSHTFVCEGVTIEDDVFVGHGVMFINDIYPRASEDGRLQTEADWKVVAYACQTRRLHRKRGGHHGRRHDRRGSARRCGSGRDARRAGKNDRQGSSRSTGSRRPAGIRIEPGKFTGGLLIRIGVIGYGYWGPNLVRNFFETPGMQVACVSDLRADRLALVHSRYPSIRTTQDFRELIEDPSIDAVAIATPVSTHYDLALRALQEGKHVLVEKPLASNTEQVQHLMDLAQKRNLVLMVDHTFVYTGAVRKIRELVDSGTLGEIYYYDSVRVNLGLFQHDVNVLWDLAVHDLSIMDYVLPFRPCAVSATGLSHLPGGTGEHCLSHAIF